MDVKEAIDELKFILEYDKYSFGIMTCEALCMAIEALERTRWIPVSEPPKESTDCLLSDGDDITIAFYSKSRNHFYSGDDIEPCATHWMQLQEPPKEVEQS